MNSSFVFDPMLPIWVIISLTVLVIAAATFGQWRGLKSFILRAIAAFILAGALLNPQTLIEQRTPLPDIALVISDNSESMAFGTRKQVSETVHTRLLDALNGLENLELINVNVAPGTDGTRLTQTMIDALAGLPADRIAGVIAITDGQVHDLPENPANLLPPGVPFHSIITGDKTARDRRLDALITPKYGMVGETARFELRLADPGFEGEQAELEIRLNGELVARFAATVGDKITIPVKIEKRGVNTVEIRASAAENELTTLNNVLVAEISGVRDRLRVLLITGEPHMGGRAWRNLLKSDPSVDLIQFTILTTPGVKNTYAPPRELSLIRFPDRELFEDKLDEFDLVIFDQFERRTMAARGRSRPILSPYYISNVSKYVENGGALLVAAGPAYATDDGLARSPLIAVLPARPTGKTTDTNFRPNLNDKGKRHPITSIFKGEISAKWGRWYRSIDAEVIKGDVLMVNDDGAPLLVVDKVRKGRVALLLSDQAWLWSKGHDGGGPYNEMFRRLSHWLMGEPDLEADRLKARVENGMLQIERWALDDKNAPVQVLHPAGTTESLSLRRVSPGYFTGSLKAGVQGAYRVTVSGNGGDDLSSIAAAGALNPTEFKHVIATDKILAPLVNVSGGGTFWAGNAGTVPTVRKVSANGKTSGADFAGLIAHEKYSVTASRRTPFAPTWIYFLLILTALLIAWRLEGN
ncbi:MAG: hypothetical protein JKY25_06680 [Robiginitomaculum sp.]|nr:hypothetical protein [Robiginitomaculum sp.]